MKCAICGQDYGVVHNCAGVAPAYIRQEEAAVPPHGFPPLYYLHLALNIVRWDDVSIRRASRDPRAGLYGAFYWAITAIVILLITAVPRALRAMPPDVSGLVAVIGLTVGLIDGLVVMGIVTFVQFGLCHLIAKWFFGATGTLAGVMRPLLLAWFVNALVLIPVVGLWAVVIAWTPVLMLVFEEVDRIGRMQAFLISAGVNLCFLALQLAIRMGHA